MPSSILFAALALPIAQAQQPPPTITRMLPLQQLCTTVREQPIPPWGSLLSESRSQRPDLVLHPYAAGTIDAEGVQAAMRTFVGPAIDDERLYLQAIGQTLLAVGERDAVDEVERRLAEGAGIVARPVHVEFCVWTDDGGTTPTVLSPDRLVAFRQGRTPLLRAVGTTRPGQPLALEHMTWTRYVRGVEVEVAQKIDVSRPETDRFGEGGHAGVRAFPLIDDDGFALHVQFAVAAQRGAKITLETGKQGAADIELPLLESYFGTCSGRIPNGGALAVTMRGHQETGGRVVLTVRAHGPEPTAISGDTTALLPIAALTTGTLGHVAHVPDLRPGDRDHDFDEQAAFGQLPLEQLLELAEGTLATEDDDYSLQTGGGFLFVHGSAGGVTRVRELLRGLQDALVQNVSITHRATLLPDTRQADATLHELLVPSLVGREVCLHRLFETNILANVHVEVAQEAGSLEPRVELLQSGTWLRARAVPVGQRLHLDLDVQSALAPMPQMRTVMPDGGVLMQERIASCRVSHDGVIDVGEVVAHGDGPGLHVAGARTRTQMTTTVRR